MFSDRTLVIATKHHKEKVMAPILELELCVHCIVSENFDTDQLGTFSGEVDRKDDAITTLRNKCLTAMKLAHCDLGIASEGSFGPHPTIFFVPADEELLILIDQKNELEIIAKEISTDTNYNATLLKSENELIEFAKLVQFPSHALILRNTKDDFSNIKKGIQDWNTLLAFYRALTIQAESVYVETDMRARYNPTRMSVIEKVTKKLIQKINSCCPKCQTPGFAVTEVIPGLPCSSCNWPTKSPLSYLYGCKHCNFVRNEKYPNQIEFENPMYCHVCNP